MNKKLEKRIRLKKKIRTKIVGTPKTPRLSVFRSNKFIYAQAIDDTTGVTIASYSDMPTKTKTPVKAVAKTTKENKTRRATVVGTNIAKVLIAKSIKACVFDRNGFKYTGRIKALADAARAAGLKF